MSTLSYANDAFSYTVGGIATSFTWPLTLAANTTLTFLTDLPITTTLQYFIIGGTGVTIDGGNHTVTITTSGNDYSGLVKNGTSTAGSGFSNCTVKNIVAINNETNDINACITRDYFGNVTDSAVTCFITNCSATTSYGTNSEQGAVVGKYNYANISNCYANLGDINSGTGGGGVVGRYNKGSISNCYAIVVGNIGRGGIVDRNNQGSISNCYVICGGNIWSGGIVGASNQGSISNCYAICGGSISGGGGIVATSNQGSISNCYVICGGSISGGGGITGGGIGSSSNQGSISNCYVICGGDIGIYEPSKDGGGICRYTTNTISNCYVICGGNISHGGIAFQTTSTISNCYVICGGDISNGGGGGIAHSLSGASASISNCHVDTTYTGNNMFVYNGTKDNYGTNNSYGSTAAWSSIGAGKLLANAWIDVGTTASPKPFILSAFNTAVTTDTNIDDSSLALTSYGQSLSNGTVTSLPDANWTYSTTSITTIDNLTSGTYTLTIYAYNLLSIVSGFAFSNDDKIETAYNVTPTAAVTVDGVTVPASTANTIVPYMYSYKSYEITVVALTTTTTTTTTAAPTHKTELSLVQGNSLTDPTTGKIQYVWSLMANTSPINPNN